MAEKTNTTPVITSPKIQFMNYVFVGKTDYETLLVGHNGSIPQVLDTKNNQIPYDRVAYLAGLQIDIFLNHKLRELTIWNNDNTIKTHGLLRLTDNQKALIVQSFIYQVQYLYSNVRLEETHNETDYSFEGVSYKIPIIDYTNPENMLCGTSLNLTKQSGVKTTSRSFNTPQTVQAKDGSTVRVVDGFFNDVDEKGQPKYQLSKVSYQVVLDNKKAIETFNTKISSIDGNVDSTTLQAEIKKLIDEDKKIDAKVIGNTNAIANNKTNQDAINTQTTQKINQVIAKQNGMQTFIQIDTSKNDNTIKVRVNETLDELSEWSDGVHRRIALQVNKKYSQAQPLRILIYKLDADVDKDAPLLAYDLNVLDEKGNSKTSGSLSKGTQYLVYSDVSKNKFYLKEEEKNFNGQLQALETRITTNENILITEKANIDAVEDKTQNINAVNGMTTIKGQTKTDTLTTNTIDGELNKPISIGTPSSPVIAKGGIRSEQNIAQYENNLPVWTSKEQIGINKQVQEQNNHSQKATYQDIVKKALNKEEIQKAINSSDIVYIVSTNENYIKNNEDWLPTLRKGGNAGDVHFTYKDKDVDGYLLIPAFSLALSIEHLISQLTFTNAKNDYEFGVKIKIDNNGTFISATPFIRPKQDLEVDSPVEKDYIFGIYVYDAGKNARSLDWTFPTENTPNQMVKQLHSGKKAITINQPLEIEKDIWSDEKEKTLADGLNLQQTLTALLKDLYSKPLENQYIKFNIKGIYPKLEKGLVEAFKGIAGFDNYNNFYSYGVRFVELNYLGCEVIIFATLGRKGNADTHETLAEINYKVEIPQRKSDYNRDTHDKKNEEITFAINKAGTSASSGGSGGGASSSATVPWTFLYSQTPDVVYGSKAVYDKRSDNKGTKPLTQAQMDTIRKATQYLEDNDGYAIKLVYLIHSFTGDHYSLAQFKAIDPFALPTIYTKDNLAAQTNIGFKTSNYGGISLMTMTDLTYSFLFSKGHSFSMSYPQYIFIGYQPDKIMFKIKGIAIKITKLLEDKDVPESVWNK